MTGKYLIIKYYYLIFNNEIFNNETIMKIKEKTLNRNNHPEWVGLDSGALVSNIKWILNSNLN